MIDVVINAPGIDLDKPRGGTVHQLELTRALQKYANVTLLSQGSPTEDITHVRIKTARMPSLTRESYSKIKQMHPDIIHDRGFLLGGGGVYAARKLGVPSVVQVDDNWFAGDRFSSPLLWKTLAYPALTKWWVRRYLNLANEIFTVSKSLKRTLEQDWACTTKITSIPNGVNIKKFAIKPDKETKEKYNPEGKKLAVFVGELAPWQGVEDILEAAKALQGQYVKFLIVGGQKTHSSYIDSLKQHAKGLDNVEFTGIVPHDDVPKILSIADVCLAPFIDSKTEFGFSPLKIFEYLGAGKPIVCTDVSWIKEIEGLETAAEFCKPANPASLVKAISKVLSNQTKRKALSVNAAKLAKEKYDWDVVAKQVITRYESLLD